MKSAGQLVLSIVLFSLLSLIVFPSLVSAQPPARPTGSIAGRIAIGSQPAPGVEVVLKKSGDPNQETLQMEIPPITTTTDAEGRYRIAILPAGTYRVSAYAPAYVIEGEKRSGFQFGKVISLAESETLESVDFKMTRGSVITGRVTDDAGKAVIAEAVGAFRLDEKGERTNDFAYEMAAWITDDRGIYRIYGLEAGRYVVGAGASSEDSMLRMGAANAYKRTYHPETQEETKAAIIDLMPGAEAENVDIKLSRAAKAFIASGRVIEAETGNPVPGVMIGYAVTKPDSFSMGFGSSATNSNGEFQLEGLAPNSYLAFTASQGAIDTYATQAKFEITDSDATGLEIKLIRGGTISGVAVVDGARDPAILAGMSAIRVSAYKKQSAGSEDMWANMGSTSSGMINANGTFRIGGVPEGKIVVSPGPETNPKGYSFVRVERNGIEFKELDLAKGEQITDVRLIFAYGTGVLSGRIDIKGGKLPPNARMIVYLLREGAADDSLFNAKQSSVDVRGQFLLEGLAPGNYRLRLETYLPNEGIAEKGFGLEQTLSILGNGRQEIHLVLDLAKKAGDK